MNQEISTEQQETKTTPELLANSAFALVFLATLAALIAFVFLVSAPVSDLPAVQAMRQIIVIAYLVVIGLLFIFCGWLLRRKPDQLLKPAQAITRLLSKPIIAVAVFLVLVEVNFLAFLGLNQIAPGITGPLKFVMVCWTLLIFGVLMIVNRQSLADWLTQTRGLWMGVGLTITLILIGLLAFLGNSLLLNSTGLLSQLRASTDQRAFPFYQDQEANPELTRDFLIEMGRFRLRWSPYTYWVMQQDSGDYINIQSNGLRYTTSFVEEDSNAPRIFFFGGSTMWGEGARDDYTIASHAARLLHEADQPAQVENFGQTGYVSTQDLILFELQLAQGNIPDVAVFYGGFNDVLSGYQHDMAGLPLSETNRARDFYTGRLLDDGQVVLRPPTNITQDDFDWSLVATASADAETILERYLANVKIIQTLADAYSIEVLFVWQPAPFHKHTMTPEETILYENVLADRPGLYTLYQAADTLLREQLTPQEAKNFLIISDLFSDTPEQIFIDVIHITENGNFAVAESMIPMLTERIE
jgi:lysophospholipase L1-like esterase